MDQHRPARPKRRGLIALAMAANFLTATLAFGQSSPPDTLGKIRESGAITLGVREASGGLSFSYGNGQYGGFHVELCQRIVAALEQSFGKKIEIKYQNVTAANRVPLVQNGTVDLECGSTSNTAARAQLVSFAMTTFIEEIRMAVKKKSGINGFDQIAGKTIVTTTGTTSAQHLRRLVLSGMQFNQILAKDHSESFLLLESDRADGFVIDTGILSAQISASKSPQDYRIVGEPLSVEPDALMLRKDDVAFKKAVDDAIKAQIRSGQLAALWDKWFMQAIPPTGKPIGLAMSANVKAAWDNPNDRPMETYVRQ
ncbi:transporter substrate-binding domain-containing protein [Xylophilus rhododendri]|uniref:Transporter substrate-binding domain-containing protein n=2 Tax=Xylophilus rhododendri TaxID=2697032 RepID=A0A857JD06_9BURK|nr:transporter substrate-binding domain-containing protein [Xylophilus rhododendri]